MSLEQPSGGESAKPRLTLCVIGNSQSIHVVNRAKCFAERGHNVYLISEQRAGVAGVTEIVPHELPHPFLSAFFWLAERAAALLGKELPDNLRPDLSLAANFSRILRQCNPDIVHVQFAYGTPAWMAAIVDRHPLVVSVMGGDVLYREQGRATPRGVWLTRELLKSADCITSSSYYLIEALEKLGGFGDKSLRVVWGVDLSLFQRLEAGVLRARLGLAAEDRVIFSPRLLQPLYNIHLIVEAMPEILAAERRARLLVSEYAADPAYKVQIAERICQLGLEESVRFTGQIPHEEMPLYFSLAEVAVALPVSDGMPIALLEAMACETPNILLNLPNYAEIVAHEESAYLVEPEPAAVAAGVIRLLRDNELAGRIVRNGLQIVRQQADFQKEVSRVEAEYYRLLQAPFNRRSLADRARMVFHLLWRRKKPLL